MCQSRYPLIANHNNSKTPSEITSPGVFGLTMLRNYD